MQKDTKRKGFNFFRSYFDVYNELNNEDKVSFIDALLERQFLGIKPEGLNGMAKFAYISQTNSIDSQVKGYEDKTKTKLKPLEKNNYTPSGGGSVGGENTPSLQVEEKEKEKGQYVYSENEFFEDWNNLRTKHLKKPSHIKSMGGFESKNKFKELSKVYTRQDFQFAMTGLFKQLKMPNGNTTMQSNPRHFLNHFEPYHQAYYDKNTALYGKKLENAS